MTAGEREAAIAALWRSGMTAPQIAGQLDVTVATVHSDVQRLRSRGVELEARASNHDQLAYRRAMIRALWPTGMPLDRLAEIIGEPRNTIVSTIRRMRQHGEPIERRMPVYTKASPQRDEILRRWERGETQEQIASELGLRREDIAARITDARLDGHTTVRRNRSPTQPLQERDRTVIRMWIAGASILDIADALGVPRQTAVDRIVSLRRIGFPLPRRRQKLPPDSDERIAALWREGVTAGQIADQLDITEPAVRGRLDRMRRNDVDLTRNRQPTPQPRAPQQPRAPTTRPRRKWQREEILTAIRAWNDEHGRPPRSMEWMRRPAPDEPDRPPASAVTSMFGSWRAGIEAAGLTVAKALYSKHDLLAAFAAGRNADVRDPQTRDDFEQWLPSLARAPSRWDRRPQQPSTIRLRQRIGELLDAGLNLEQIASMLEVSPATVGRHAAAIRADQTATSAPGAPGSRAPRDGR